MKKAKEIVKKGETKATNNVTPKPEVKATEKGLERPTMPADFCLDKKDWDGNSACFDKDSNNCKACKKDFPKTHSVCEQRAEFLAKTGKETKAKKTSSGERVRKDGVASQTKIINEGIKAKLPKIEIAKNVAKAHYGNNEAGVAIGMKRVDRHLKSIMDGSCNSSATYKPLAGYLFKAEKPAAPAHK